MNWLLCIPSLCGEDGGPPNASLQTARALHASGDSVTVIAMRSAGEALHPAADLAAREGVNVVVLPAGGAGATRLSLSFVKRFWGIARDADAVHVHGVYHAVALLVLVWHLVTGRAYSFQPHGVLERYQEQRHRWRKAVVAPIARTFVRRAHAALIAHESERVGVLHAGVEESEIVVVGMGVDVPPRLDQTGSSPDVPVIVYLSRLAEKKRVDLLLAAAEELIRRYQIRLQVKIGGSGGPAHLKRLRDLSDELGVSSSVQWLGHVEASAKDALLASGTVYCLPSDNENFGQAVVEAMAAGLPVVTTRGVGSSGFVRQAKGGEIVETGDLTALVDALRMFVCDPELAKEVGERGRCFAARNFDWSAVARAWRGAWNVTSQPTPAIPGPAALGKSFGKSTKDPL